jgi:hypothetical protein
MSRARYFALCALALLGAFAGGYAANSAIPIAHAQTATESVRASSFTLVDPQGKVQATLSNGAKGAELVLNGPAGKSRIELSAAGGVTIRDMNGRIVWAAPRMGIFPASE